MALRVRIPDFNKEFDSTKVVHNPKDYENGQFTQDGIFSEEIFGNYQSNSLQRGWIDFGEYYIIHPLLFPFLKKVIPKLLKFIEVQNAIDLEGNKIVKNANAIGLNQFYQNFDSILEEYGNKDIPEYKFIMKNKDVLFINKFPILPSKLRATVVVKETVTGSKVNRTYKYIIRYSNKLKESNEDIEGSIELNKFAWKLQFYVNRLTKEIEAEFIRKKKGYIRNNMLGSKLNYSARLVLGPLIGQDIDIVALPYRCYLELYKKQLINIISKTKGISLIKADLIWRKATLSFDPEIYKYMCLLNKKTKGGQYILLNRNPTINVSSLMRLKIGIIKKDYNDNILQISNNILNGMNADYDGDVLNLYPLFNRNWVEAFKAFSPERLIIDLNKGGFNTDYSLDKEQKIAFYLLNNKSKRSK